MSFTFPYQYRSVDSRNIPYPIVTVFLHTKRGNRAYSFIMDTGADTLTLPKYMIELLEIDKNVLIRSQAQGIGETLVTTWEGQITIDFCNQSFLAYCSFTDNDSTPLLLGKENIFDKFNVIFDNDRKQTVFEEKKSLK